MEYFKRFYLFVAISFVATSPVVVAMELEEEENAAMGQEEEEVPNRPIGMPPLIWDLGNVIRPEVNNEGNPQPSLEQSIEGSGSKKRKRNEINISENPVTSSGEQSGQAPAQDASLDEGALKKARVTSLNDEANLELRATLANAINGGFVLTVGDILKKAPKNTAFFAASGGSEALVDLAISTGSLDILRLLHQAGASLVVPNADKDLPIHVAAEFGHQDIVEYLLANGATIFDPNGDGDGPMHTAVRNNQLNLVKFFLDVERLLASHVNNFGSSPLHLACMSGNIDIVKLLLVRDRTMLHAKSRGGFYPMTQAAMNGHDEILELLIDSAPNLFLEHVHILFDPQTHHPDVISPSVQISLLKKLSELDITRIKSDAMDEKILDAAIQHGYFDIVEHFFNKSKKLFTAEIVKKLVLFGIEKNTEIVKKVLSSVDRVILLQVLSQTVQNSIHIAAIKGSFELTKFMIEILDKRIGPGSSKIVIDINSTSDDLGVSLVDFQGQKIVVTNLSLLHAAVLGKNAEIVQYLLAKAPYLAKTKDGRSFRPIHYAAYYGFIDILRILFGHSGWQTSQKISVVHAAVAGGQIQVLDFLYAVDERIRMKQTITKERVPFNESDARGYAPLHVACYADQREALIWLIDKLKVSPDLPTDDDSDEQDGFHIAAKFGASKVLDLYVERGYMLPSLRNFSECKNFKTITWLLRNGFSTNQLSQAQIDENNLTEIVALIQREDEQSLRKIFDAFDAPYSHLSALLFFLVATKKYDDLVLEVLNKFDLKDRHLSIELTNFASIGSVTLVDKIYTLARNHLSDEDFVATIRSTIHLAAQNGNDDVVLMLLQRVIVHQAIDKIDFKTDWQLVVDRLRRHRSMKGPGGGLLSDALYASLVSIERYFMNAAYVQQCIAKLKSNPRDPNPLKQINSLPEEVQQQIIAHMISN